MLVDANARANALNIANKLIKAPAGSGKTGLLANYYLKLLGVVEHPNQIQAMTFTNKSSREMVDRISSSINRVKKGFVPGNDFEQQNYDLAKAALKNSDARGWNLDKNPNLLQISTIDSFCKKILINKAGTGNNMLATRNIATDPVRIYEKTVRETLALYSDELHGPSIQKLMKHFGNKTSRVQTLLVEMLASRERWIPILFSSKDGGRMQLESKRKAFVEIVLGDDFKAIKHHEASLQFIISQLAITDTSLLKFFDTGFSADLTESRDTFAALAKVLLTGDRTPRKRFTKNEGMPKEISKGDKSMLVDDLKGLAADVCEPLGKLSTMPECHFNETEWALLDSVFKVMPVLLANLKIQFKAFGEVDFAEVSMSAIGALNSEGDNVTDAAVHYSQTLKHLMVDEFQDCNNLQMTMLKSLMSAWTEDDCNSLFLVGDAMQSLYGFRSANVNLFMQAEENGVGELPFSTLELKTNFRSSNGIVDWVNRTFSAAFPKSNDLVEAACSYNPSVAVNLGEEPAPVEVHGFTSDLNGAAEAKYIVGEIQAIREKEPTASIAVLGRTRTALKPLLSEIQNTDIKSHDIDLNKISKEPIAIQAIALARVLIDDLDKTAWLTLLNGGLCGLTLASIEKLLKGQNDPFLALLDDDVESKLNPEETLRFDNFMNVIKSGLELKQRRDFHTILTGLWIKLNGGSLAKTKRCQQNVETVFDLFKDQDLNVMTLPWLERQLEKLYAKVDETKSTDKASAVQFMTIHQSKGMEFDYVFIPSMHKTGVTGQSNLVTWSEISGYEDQAVLACSQEIGIKKDEADYYRFLNKLQAQRENQELTRLVYVAVTRAIKKAHLTGTIRISKDEISAPTKGSMFAVIYGTCRDEMVIHDGDSESRIDEITPKVNFIDVDVDIQLPVRNTLAAYRGSDHNIKLKSGFQWDKPLSKKEGIVIHRLIEQINRDGIEAWPIERVNEYSSVILSLLKELSIEQSQLINSVNKIKKVIVTMLQSEDFKELVARHVVDDVELKVALRKNRKVHFLQIDRAYIENQNKARVIDWKSALYDVGNMQSFIQNQQVKHRQKMRMYTQAYAEIHDIKAVDGALYLTSFNKLAECG